MTTRIHSLFNEKFGTGGRLYASPGRVNLIGEHTDYNLGFVLPGAIDKAIYLKIKPNGTKRCRLFSADYDEGYTFDLSATETPDRQWARYIFGVVCEIEELGRAVEGFDCVFGGDVPLGAGLSSSAALESVTGFALDELFGLGLSRRELARVGQLAEHNYAGVRCGIMDQFASLFGERGKLIRLDCRSLDYKLVPFDPVGYRVLLLDTQVKHSLASTAYNERRAQCEAGVDAVAAHVPGVGSLREVTFEMLDAYKSEMTPLVYRRCHYVLSENRRLLDACDALEAADYATFGAKMFASHDGLSRQYEVSCPELDFLVDRVRGVDGVMGARMMGGGFGGCTINIVRSSIHDQLVAEVSAAYEARFGIVPRVIDAVIGDGARRLE